MVEYKAYCVKCKTNVIVTDPVVEQVTNSKGTRSMVKGTHSDCGTKVCVFIKKE